MLSLRGSCKEHLVGVYRSLREEAHAEGPGFNEISGDLGFTLRDADEMNRILDKDLSWYLLAAEERKEVRFWNDEKWSMLWRLQPISILHKVSYLLAFKFRIEI